MFRSGSSRSRLRNIRMLKWEGFSEEVHGSVAGLSKYECVDLGGGSNGVFE